MDKRWSFDLNRFYRMSVCVKGEGFWCFPRVLGPFVRGLVDLYCNSLSRFFSTSLLYILYLLIKKICL